MPSLKTGPQQEAQQQTNARVGGNSPVCGGHQQGACVQLHGAMCGLSYLSATVQRRADGAQVSLLSVPETLKFLFGYQKFSNSMILPGSGKTIISIRR